MKKLCIGLFVLLSLSGCSGSEGGVVEMAAAQKFAPEQLTISPGDTISFKNTSSEPHTVTAYSDGLPEGAEYFSSGGSDSEEEARDGLSEALIPAGESFELTLDVAGTYRYFCIPHEGAGMRGTIVIEG